MELHFNVFPDRGNLGPWKPNKPFVGFLVSTGLGKIIENTKWVYQVDYSSNVKSQANMFQIQRVT